MPAAPATWPIDRSVFPALPDDPSTPAYAYKLQVQLAAEDTAVQILWALSGRQYGIQQVKIRPCANENQPLTRRWESMAIVDDFGLMQDCACHGRCVYSSPQMVHLPGPVYQDATGDYPVIVQVNDSVLDPDEYVVENDVLHNRFEFWPMQNYAKPLGEPGTWSVQYWRGTPPPAVLALFTGCLALEIINARCGDNCRLPRAVIFVARGGVSYEVDALKIINAGKTGLQEIDLWLAAINPSALRQPPRVM